MGVGAAGVDLVRDSFASADQPASPGTPAPYAGSVRLFLHLPACAGLGVLGARLVFGVDVGRHRPAYLYPGGDDCLCAHGGPGHDLDARMDTSTGSWLAAIAPKRVPDSHTLRLDRKSVVSGKSVSVRVDLGGRRIINNKK